MITKTKYVIISFWISLFIQFITTYITTKGVFIADKLHNSDKILKDILIGETVVQLIEFSLYMYLAFLVTFKSLSLSSAVHLRYFDWFLTTPTMLISLIMYMQYHSEKSKEKSNETDDYITSYSFIKDYKFLIILLVLSNALMLLFGYLGETKRINKEKSITVGFAFFFITFYIIRDKFGKSSETNLRLFNTTFVLWGLYGVAALQNDALKNICYNILDLLSKNFYGIFLVLYVYNKVLSNLLHTSNNNNIITKKIKKCKINKWNGLTRKEACDNENQCLTILNYNFECLCDVKCSHFPKIISFDPDKYGFILSNCGLSLDNYNILVKTKKIKPIIITNIDKQIECIIYNLKKSKIKHLDIKPGNICINKNGILSLIDFDISSIDNNYKSWKIKKRANSYDNGGGYYINIKNKLITIINNHI